MDIHRAVEHGLVLGVIEAVALALFLLWNGAGVGDMWIPTGTGVLMFGTVVAITLAYDAAFPSRRRF